MTKANTQTSAPMAVTRCLPIIMVLASESAHRSKAEQMSQIQLGKENERLITQATEKSQLAEDALVRLQIAEESARAFKQVPRVLASDLPTNIRMRAQHLVLDIALWKGDSEGFILK
eukprot:2392379-Amphidinium_carterae.1